jgi:Ca-activated chloride channel family protein
MWMRRWQLLPQFLKYGALFLFFLAFIDPHILIPKASKGNLPPKEPLEGIAIYLILDQSGSMEEKVDAVLPNGSRRIISKIDLLKETTKAFVQSRPNDMIGLIGFARGAQVLDPLTLDHQAILDQLSKLDVQRGKNQEGTSLGYAIYKTANLITATRNYAQDLQGEGQPAYTIKSAIMILVTDGVPEPNPLDQGKRFRNMSIPEASDYAKQQQIRLYIINVDPGFVSNEYEPFRKQMKEATESTGGRFFIMSGATSLVQIYHDIDKLEKSKFPGQPEILELLQEKLPKDKLPNLYRRVSFYPYLVALGMLALLLSILLKTTVMRKVP